MTNLKAPNLLWYVLYTRPKFEKKIFMRLQEKRIETFLPLQKVVRQWRDRKKKVEVPLFPNYLFVHITQGEKWKVLNTYGAVRFLRFGQQDSILSEKEIDTIRKSLLGYPIITNRKYNVGDKLKIINGPLCGLEGHLTTQRGRNKLAITIKTIDRSILVEVSPTSLAIANSIS